MILSLELGWKQWMDTFYRCYTNSIYRQLHISLWLCTRMIRNELVIHQASGLEAKNCSSQVQLGECKKPLAIISDLHRWWSAMGKAPSWYQRMSNTRCSVVASMAPHPFAYMHPSIGHLWSITGLLLPETLVITWCGHYNVDIDTMYFLL